MTEVIVNPFMASGASGTLINDFAGDNFDHSGLGFIGGAFIGAVNTNGRPIEYHPTPPGTPAWGKGWKEAVVKHYNHTVMFSLHGSSVSQRQNYLDLDPTYRDAWGQPLLRMTFDFPQNDLKMAEYVTAKAVEIGKAMGAKQVAGAPRKAPYTTHAVSNHAQHRRRGDGERSDHERRQPLSAILGRAQCVRDRRVRLSAERVVESDRHLGCPDLLGDRCAQE